MNQQQALAVVEAYLKQHFGDIQITTKRLPEDNGCAYQFSCSEGDFSLLVLDEVLSDLEHDQAIQQLEMFQVADVLRSMDGFPITVTTSGCIFE